MSGGRQDLTRDAGRAERLAVLPDLPPPIRPIHVTLKAAVALTGESKASLYRAIEAGQLTPIKNGWRTLLIYNELEARCAARPTGLRKRRPEIIAGREAYEAKRKKKRRE
jgi:hypothetical protein